jgi:hypothetical protein
LIEMTIGRDRETPFESGRWLTTPGPYRLVLAQACLENC